MRPDENGRKRLNIAVPAYGILPSRPAGAAEALQDFGVIGLLGIPGFWKITGAPENTDTGAFTGTFTATFENSDSLENSGTFADIYLTEGLFMKLFKLITAGLIASVLSAFSAGCGTVTVDSGIYRATADEMAEAALKTPYNEPVRGIWVTPRMSASARQDDYNEAYKQVKEAGINMVFTFDETSSKSKMEKLLEACKVNEIKAIISLPRISNSSQIKNQLKLVNEYDSHPAVLGYNLYDEPGRSVFEVLGEEYNEIRKICSPDKIIMINFFPNYVSPEAIDFKDEGARSWYQNYLYTYYDMAASDVVSFDNYPYRADPAGDEAAVAGTVSNLCDIAMLGRDKNLPCWGFVQCGEWGGTRTPDYGELRYLAHLHLLFGLKGYSYFLYVTPVDGSTEEGVFKGMVTFQGEKTKTYENVQKLNKELDGMKGVYLDYGFKGVIERNLPDVIKNSISATYAVESFGGVSKIATDGRVIIGCFEKSDGHKALYLLNNDPYNDTEVTVTLSELSEFKLWSGKGIEDMGADREILIRLGYGEGKFLEF